MSEINGGPRQICAFVEVCLRCQEVGMLSLRLADTSGTSAKRRSLSDGGRLPEQRMPHTIPGVWNLSWGEGVLEGGVQEQMDGLYSFNTVGWDGYSVKRFPIRSSLSRTIAADETPPLQPPLPDPVPGIHSSTGSGEQTPLPFENIHPRLGEPLTPTCNWQHTPRRVPQISGINFKPANLTYYIYIFFFFFEVS